MNYTASMSPNQWMWTIAKGTALGYGITFLVLIAGAGCLTVLTMRFPV